MIKAAAATALSASLVLGANIDSSFKDPSCQVGLTQVSGFLSAAPDTIGETSSNAEFVGTRNATIPEEEADQAPAAKSVSDSDGDDDDDDLLGPLKLASPENVKRDEPKEEEKVETIWTWILNLFGLLDWA